MRKSSVYKLFGTALAGMALCGLSTVNVSAETSISSSVEGENLTASPDSVQAVTNSQVQTGLEVNKNEELQEAGGDLAAAASTSTSTSEMSMKEAGLSLASAITEVNSDMPSAKASMTEVLQVSTELELREAVENAVGPVTIKLNEDITMTDPYPDHPGGLTQPYPAMLVSQYGSERAALFIDVGKDITLIGEHKLIGTGSNTITLHGNLTLDGPVITHQEGTVDSAVGIRVGKGIPVVDYLTANPPAYLLFKSGEICNNNFVGILATYGDILMTGGKIYGNGTLDGSHVGGGIGLTGNGMNTSIPEEAKFGGTAVIQGGEIYDNQAIYGGGVYLDGDEQVSLEISGRDIYNNEAKYYGGGICSVYRSVKLKIAGGKIRDNQAGYYGGGVYFCSPMTMTDGAVYDNTAQSGGGIYSLSDLNISGGEIRGNKAGYYGGGGIYTSDYNRLTIGADVIFSGNTADKLTQLLETDENFAVYREKISVPDGKWSVQGIKYGYNNYDINFDGLELEILSLTFLAGEGGSLSGVTEYPNVAYGTLFGQVMVPAVQAAEGYVFAGWSPVLPSSAQALTENAVYTAVFVKKPVIPEPEPTSPDPEVEPEVIPVPEPESTDVPKAPELPESAPTTTINSLPMSQTMTKKLILPNTGDEQRSLVLVAGGLAVLSAALLGVMTRLKGRKH
ncbi:LPXTG cell wall anchor domain-containing protein [Lactovum odontotermitis]